MSVGIERKIQGQCDCGAGTFESIQIKTVLKREFEMVLKSYSKHSKLDREMPMNEGLLSLRISVDQSTRSGFINEAIRRRFAAQSHGGRVLNVNAQLLSDLTSILIPMPLTDFAASFARVANCPSAA
jgi:hypothetical protein